MYGEEKDISSGYSRVAYLVLLNKMPRNGEKRRKKPSPLRFNKKYFINKGLLLFLWM